MPPRLSIWLPHINRLSPWSLKRLAAEVTNALAEKAKKYGKGCQGLDALVYADLQDQHLNAKSEFPDVGPLRAQGWRSVSVIFAPYSVILLGNPGAPDFLLDYAGRVQDCWKQWDTLFDP
jgi:hypothetical protein